MEEVLEPCTVWLYVCDLLSGKFMFSDCTANAAGSCLTCCTSTALGDASPEVSALALLSFALGFANGLKMSEASRLTAGGLVAGFGAGFFELSSLAAGFIAAAATAAPALACLSITFNCALGGTIAFAKGALVTFRR